MHHQQLGCRVLHTRPACLRQRWVHGVHVSLGKCMRLCASGTGGKSHLTFRVHPMCLGRPSHLLALVSTGGHHPLAGGQAAEEPAGVSLGPLGRRARHPCMVSGDRIAPDSLPRGGWAVRCGCAYLLLATQGRFQQVFAVCVLMACIVLPSPLGLAPSRCLPGIQALGSGGAGEGEEQGTAVPYRGHVTQGGPAVLSRMIVLYGCVV